MVQVYPYGKLDQPDIVEGMVIDGHDSRGHCEWIETVESNPHICMPSELK